MSFVFRSASGLLLVAACAGDPPEGTDTAGSTSGACAGALELVPGRAGVPTLEGTRFRATGATEARTFRFVSNRSGGILQPTTGDYVAGETAGVTDVVAVDDPGCDRSATAEVLVTAPMALVPERAEVPPGTRFLVRNQGGSGDVACTLVSATSQGALEDCWWTAGPVAGIDEVLVEDPLTGEQARAIYTVDPEAALRVVGEELYLPQGHPFALSFTGGTSLVDVEVPDGLLLEGGSLTGVEPGDYAVTATDRYVPGMSTTFRVAVAAPRTVVVPRDGEGTDWVDVVAGDIDGDGRADAVVGSMEVSVGAHFSGGVHVYAGGEDGLEDAPVGTFTLDQASAFAGRAVALGDVDGDGQLDLAVGADGWDEADRVDAGRVDVYPGVPGGFFEATPGWTQTGAVAGDHLGSALAICDVDGDGIDDLVSAGFGIEAPGGARSNEGGLEIYAGGAKGLAEAPSWSVYSGEANAQMGRRLAAGHVDGDERCDLAVASLTRALDGAGEDGIVWLYTGASILEAQPIEPVRRYTAGADDPQIQFGRSLALAPIDGDDLDDLVVGAELADAGGADRGAVYVFAEADHVGTQAGGTVLASQARASIVGEQDGDRLGQALSLGTDRLWVGASGASTVYGFDAAALEGALSVSDAVRVVRPKGATALGAGLAALDVHGTGDRVLAFATRDGAYGVEVGAPWAIPEEGAARRLAFPGEVAGTQLGSPGSLGWFDFDDNGDFDLLAGTWGAPGPAGINAGVAHVYSGFAGRWGPRPDRVLDEPPTNEAYSRFGASVATAGDFDGNGEEDFVVVAPRADRPATWDPATYVDAGACEGQPLADAGIAWVYRGGSSEPTFAIVGADENGRIETVAGGFDFDDDGFDDLVLGSRRLGVTGGFALVRGRPSDADGIRVICSAERWLGVSAGSRLGSSVTAVGDVDGDGCDELAVGADGDQLGQDAQGSVRVMFGYGPRCPGHREPEVVTLVSGVSGDQLGLALAGGGDVDGDGVPDLAMSGRIADGTGAVWLASGAWLAAQPRDPAVELPLQETTRVRLEAATRFSGTLPDRPLGTSLAMVEHPSQRRALVAVGHPAGDVGGVLGAGGGWLLGYDAAGRPSLAGVVGGASMDPGSELGASLAADPRQPVLAVGAPLSDAATLDGGAVFLFELR